MAEGAESDPFAEKEEWVRYVEKSWRRAGREPSLLSLPLMLLLLLQFFFWLDSLTALLKMALPLTSRRQSSKVPYSERPSLTTFSKITVCHTLPLSCFVITAFITTLYHIICLFICVQFVHRPDICAMRAGSLSIFFTALQPDSRIASGSGWMLF